MTSPAALPHDPLLPQLPMALDASAMAAVFAAQWQAQGASLGAADVADLGDLLRTQVHGCEIERVKYRPRRNLAVAYRLLMRGHDGTLRAQRVAVRFCTGGESARRAAKARAALQPGGAVGLACTHHAALDMVAHWWPHDPKLGQAARLLGDEQALATQALPELVASLTAGRGRLLTQQLALVQVVPEHRASARVALQFEPAAGRAPASRTVYAKTDAEQRGAVTHAVMTALWRSPAAARGQLITPEPLLWQAGLGLHWQAELPGRALLDVEPSVRPDTSAQVGAMLAALHATPVPASRRCDFDVLRERISMVADTLSLVRGDSAPVDGLVARLAAGLSHLHGLPNQTLHGDLHPRNLLVHEGRLGLIDLDSVRQGPALLELGDWVADALYRALLAAAPVATVLPACRAFVAAYVQASGWHPAEPALAWSVAHSLVTQRVWRCVVNLKPGRFALVSSLLALADALLCHGALDAVAPPMQEAA